MYRPILRPGAQRKLKKLGDADLVIGLPTYKNPEAAARVARVALAGARQHFPDLTTVLINADAGYKAVTRRVIAGQAAGCNGRQEIIAGRYEGALGYGSATAALIDAGLALDARAVVILDSNTHSITPDWVAGLAYLILHDKADLVMPRYHWAFPDGALSDLIAYPLFRALWGHSLRHPAAPDFALSPRLATALLDQDIWETEVARFGLPPWLATYAIVGNWRVAQSALGEKTLASHPPMPGSERLWLKQAGYSRQFQLRFRNIVSVLLHQLSRHEASWANVDSFRSLATLTRFVSQCDRSPGSEGDISPLLDTLALGWIEYRALWQRILRPDNLAQLESLASLPVDRFYFPPNLWARVVYDFAVSFNKSDDDPRQIAGSLFPLFWGRLAAFQQEIAGLSVVGQEGTIAAQAVEFEEMRPYLKSRWYADSPDSPRRKIL